MKSFLSSLVSFAHSMGGLVVVIVLALWQTNPLSYTTGFVFSLGLVGSILSTLVVTFAIIWAALKERHLLAHLLLALVFANALSALFQAIVALNFGGSFYQVIIEAVAFLYTLGVVLGELLVARPKVTTYPMDRLYPLLLTALVLYLGIGWTAVVWTFIPVVLALLLGSRTIALLYATASVVGYVFIQTNLLVAGFAIGTLVLVLLFAATLVYLVLDLVKAFKAQEA